MLRVSIKMHASTVDVCVYLMISWAEWCISMCSSVRQMKAGNVIA